MSLIDVYIMQFADRENAKRVFDRGLLAISGKEERMVLLHSRKERTKRAP